MQVNGGKPWRLLLAKLRCTDDARVSYAEVLAAGSRPSSGSASSSTARTTGTSLPGASTGVCRISTTTPGRRRGWWAWRARASRRAGRVDVGAARRGGDPHVPGEGRLRGARRHQRDRAPGGGGAGALRPGGLLRRRGLSVAVVWLQSDLRVELLCRGLRAQLKRDGLIVLMPRRPATSVLVDGAHRRGGGGRRRWRRLATGSGT